MKPMKWCPIPIIPLVYTESLSYMEMVGKCVRKINEIIKYVGDTLINQFEEELSRLIINTAYDAETETLTINIVVGDE